jgi:hypothetical protein
VIETILRRSGKLNMHLVPGVPDKQVKTLGFEGQSSLRQNFSYVVDIQRLFNGTRQATLAANGTGQTMMLPYHPKPVHMEPPAALVLPDTDEPEPAGSSGSDDDTLIRQLVACGTSTNKIADVLGGNRQATLARIRAIVARRHGM